MPASSACPTFVASDWIVQGALKVVLADSSCHPFWLSAVYPRTQRGAFKLRCSSRRSPPASPAASRRGTWR